MKSTSSSSKLSNSDKPTHVNNTPPSAAAVGGVSFGALVVFAFAFAWPNHEDHRQVPAPSPAAVEWVSLEAECEASAERLRRLTGFAGTVIVHPPLIVSGSLSSKELADIEQSHLRPFLKAFRQTYSLEALQRPIVVLLYHNEAELHEAARVYFGEHLATRYGVYLPAQQTLLANVEAGPGAAQHELTHALLSRDGHDWPLWWSEGLATLYEAGEVSEDGKLVGHLNWRFAALKPLVSDQQIPPLRELLASDELFHQQPGVAYATAQAFCCFLQARGWLVPLAERWQTDASADPRGVRTLERVTGMKLPQIEAEFCAWMLEQPAGEIARQ